MKLESSCAWRYANARNGKFQFQLRQDTITISVQRFRHRRAEWRIAFFVSVAALTSIYCALYGGPVRLIMFISGILLYETINSRVPTPNYMTGLVALTLGLATVLLPWFGSIAFSFKITALFVAFLIFCLSCFREPSAWLPRAFSITPLRWFGNMSYSYFLLHGVVLKSAFVVLAMLLPVAAGGTWMFWTLLPGMFALTLFPSAILFLAIERPYSIAPRRTLSIAANAPSEHSSCKIVETTMQKVAETALPEAENAG